MATSNNFSEYYKTISNTELLIILQTPGDYQPLAVEAAKKEFFNRQLSDSEIKEAKQPLITKQIQKEKESKKVKAIEDKVKNIGHNIIDTVSPIQPGIPSTEKTIRLITIVFGGIFLYQFIKEFRTHLGYVKDIPNFPFESILYLLFLLIPPTAIFTFWKRISIGWILLAMFLTFSTVEVLWIFVDTLKRKPSEFADLDILFPKSSPITYIIQTLFFIGTLFVICKTNIREVFSIDKQKMFATIVLTGLLTFFLLFVFS